MGSTELAPPKKRTAAELTEFSNRINAELRRGTGCGVDVADWKSAIQQNGILRYGYAVAGAGVPRPPRSGLAGLGSTSPKGVAACAPVGGVTSGGGGGGVNLPVRMISSTWVPSRVSYSRRQLAIICSLSRLLSMMSLALR